MLLAKEENRVITTHDSDFGRLVFTNSLEFLGIIYLRPGHFNPQFTCNSWEVLVDAKLDYEPPFIVVLENTGQQIKIRYRQL